MAKGSVITEELFRTVKQLQKIHDGITAEQLAQVVRREATVIRKMMKCRDWAEYCEFKKAKAQKERERVKKAAEEPKDAEEQVPGQIRMELLPAEEDPVPEMVRIETIDPVKLMRFQAAQVDKLIMKLEKLNDTMSMILRAVRKE